MIANTQCNVTPLPKIIIGTGEVKGYKFRQIKATKYGFIYEQLFGKGKHYEVFKRRINTRFGNVSYPTSKAFGKWAWSTSTLERAEKILESFKE